MEHLDYFQFFVQELFAGSQIVAGNFFLYVGSHLLPGFIFPVRGNVFGARVFAVVGYVDQVAASFPDQRGTLPGLILGENFGEFCCALWIVAGEKFGFVLVTFQEFVFQRRAAFKDTDEMFKAIHSGVGHVGGTNGIGDVTFKMNFLFARFIGNGLDNFG